MLMVLWLLLLDGLMVIEVGIEGDDLLLDNIFYNENITT